RSPGEGPERCGQVELFLRKELLAYGVRVRGPGDGDLDLSQRVRRADGPIAPEGQGRPRSQEAGERVLPVRPLGAQERDRQLAHLWVQAGPERLAVRHDVEGGKPRQVV